MAVLPGKAQAISEAQALLRVVAEELKLPLMQIARTAELAQLTKRPVRATFEDIEHSASSALELIDSYVLGLQLAEQQATLELEPVSLSMVLYDTAHSLQDFARRHDTDIRLEFSHAFGPVMAHEAGLKAALLSLGRSMVEAQPAEGKHTLTLALRRAQAGLAAGIYGDNEPISAAHLRAACRLFGQMRQPLNEFSTNATAGVFVANSILAAMAARLRTSRHHNQTGLAAVLQPSRQLQLV